MKRYQPNHASYLLARSDDAQSWPELLLGLDSMEFVQKICLHAYECHCLNEILEYQLQFLTFDLFDLPKRSWHF